MATKAVRASVSTTIVPVWALPTALGAVDVKGGNLGIEVGGAMTLAFTNGTATAAGTIGMVALGTAGVAGVPLPELAMSVTGAGGLGVKKIAGNDGTVVGYLSGREKSRI